MLTITKEIEINSNCRKPGYVKDMYTDGVRTTVKLFGVPVYRYTNTVKRSDENPQAATADKKPTVMRFRDGVTINLYEPVTYLGRRTNMFCDEDMSHLTVITKDDIREPTKWEVIKMAYILLRHLSKGKGLSRKILANAFTKFKAAPWKASQASSEKDTEKAPDSPPLHSDTECRPPQSGQTSSEHSRSMERNT